MSTASLLTILTHNHLSTFIFQVGSSLCSLGWPGTRLYNPSTGCFPSTGNASLPSAQLHLASLSRLFYTHLQPNKNWYYLKLSPEFLSLLFFCLFYFSGGCWGVCVEKGLFYFQKAFPYIVQASLEPTMQPRVEILSQSSEYQYIWLLTWF